MHQLLTEGGGSKPTARERHNRPATPRLFTVLSGDTTDAQRSGALLSMRHLLLWAALALLLLAGCGRQTPPQTIPATATVAPTADTNAIVVVAMGDSLTEGFGVEPEMAYPAQLERRLQAEGYDVTVINAGNSGETSSGALARTGWVLNLQPDIIILATGGNDGLRGLEPTVTQENLERMVAQFREAGVVVVLAGMEMVQNMGEEYTAAFRALYPAVSDGYDLILVPFFLEGVAADPNLNQADFIHPTAEGYALVVENLTPYVIQAIESVEPFNRGGQ